ncbi:MAG: hypothetical protein F9K32_13750 [Desulfobulbaceae bacterium]|nr:MAG: hypothetical protein F9K32_13750 [Desulfobulbaceae bacterium]
MNDELLDLPPRGLSLLHACQPEARRQIETLSDIVIASGIRRPAFNVLVSGDFGWDPDLLAGLVAKYSRAGRIPHVLFYLANGPAARHWQGQVMDGFGSRMSPEEFRQKIAGDTLFQQSFQHLAARLVPLACLIGRAGGRAAIVPQLEDNQTNAGFLTMRNLVGEALPRDVAVGMGRNPCVGCWPGNEGKVPADCFPEEHHHSAATDFTVRNGVVSNDGCTYAFAGEKPGFLPCLPLARLAGVQSRTGDLGSVFLLWSAKYQGLDAKGTPPARRNYVMPTATEKEQLVAFLRQR